MKRLLSLSGLSAALLLFVVACTETEPTAIVVSIATDLWIPDAIDGLELRVNQRGQSRFAQKYSLDPSQPGSAKLPATMWLLAGNNPVEPIHVIVTGFAHQEPAIMREARLPFVAKRTLLLRMNLLRSCLFRAEPCPPETTCTEDGCSDIDIDPDSLPAYAESEALAGLDLGPPLPDAAADSAPDLPADLEVDLPDAAPDLSVDLLEDAVEDAVKDAVVDIVIDAAPGCDGCVSGDACLPGNAPAACGLGGEACKSCVDSKECTDNLCSGGSCTNPTRPDKTPCANSSGICCSSSCMLGGTCCHDADCAGCVGTATPCTSYVSPSFCNAQQGCSWGAYKCVGGTIDCASLGEAGCPSCPECFWNQPMQTCDPIGNLQCAAPGRFDPICSDCGCTWAPPVCEGTETACEDLSDAIDCNNQDGCHWEQCVNFVCQ